MEKVNVGVIGAGFIGRIHIEMFSALENAEVLSLCDFNQGLAQKTAAAYGIKKVTSSPEELMKDPELHAIIIAIPNKFHKELTIEALNHGKHVLVEKPMTLSGRESLEIVELKRSRERIVMVPHQLRWDPLFIKVKKLQEEGAFGKIYFAKASMLGTCNIPGWGSWFTRKSESGGGPLIDQGVHYLDLMLHLMGNPKPVSVFGTTYAEFGPHKRGTGQWGTPQWDGYFDVEDLGAAMIKMEDGSTLLLQNAWALNTDPKIVTEVHLMGTEAGASLASQSMDTENLILSYKKFGETCVTEIERPKNCENPRILLSKHFVECIQTGETPISDEWSGYVNNTVIDAIYESAKTGKSVELTWE